MATRLSSSSVMLLSAVALLNGACEPPYFLPPGQAGTATGVLEGTVTYAGPLPCTEGGRIVGAAVIEVFNVDLLPPPEGLGSSAASLAVVTGEQLFDGVRAQIQLHESGGRWCPGASDAPVTVSASWAASPLDAGVYQVRGFYDRDGDFNPGLIVKRVPTKGDVAGGAVDNASEVLLGAAPVYRAMTLGTPQDDGSYAIDPDTGSIIGGVSVTLALPLPDDVPVFYAKDVFYSTKACDNGTVVAAPPIDADPNKVSMPSDYMLPQFDLLNTEDSLVRIVLGAGVPGDEVEAAVGSPFGFPVKPSAGFHFQWRDVNGDGQFSMPGDNVADSTSIPWLMPLVVFNKLDASQTDAAQKRLVPQASPVVILQGLTIYQGFMQTAMSNALDTYSPELIAAVRPAAICIDPLDKTKGATLLVTHKWDCAEANPVIADEATVMAALKVQFGRDFTIKEACLPQGEYAMNVVYSSGQAWTLPNEAGVCAANEPSPEGQPDLCGSLATPAHRPRLGSQDVVLTIRGPDQAQYCKDHPTPPECCPNGDCG